ncbi:F0F1 ATP synthase subunit alpha [Thalassobacter stenotrophicus]|uniref:ATP synthase subunit alpha n=2 Tax=Thalassobacter stenotrophicus TaxID=266809 RepID=A0A0P1EX54_9RHOB|nr:F0F1 ATP synthase subunit alpha [Thalassobacter stenotrophicus]PVZ47825.1 F0F1 ATP synthase subunit alpha [Thalassobacter stenotrophicus]CUH59497.1 ATP synthase subunit alpha [Thalassobacter stenotrophicus]SHI82200.1 F-type H+-transporting ATPase subunit alpha [Thalassobacter stenotrophicus DSM 16310]
MNASLGPQPIEPETVLDLLLHSPSPAPLLSEVGTVTQVGDGIAIVAGLERALADEVLEFACGLSGIVLDLEPGRLGVVVLGPSDQIMIGEAVKRTRKVVSTRVGPGLLGRVVDPLGAARDGLGAVKHATLHPVEAEAPAIRDRQAITHPLATGIKAIDAAVPVGLGQRQLVIGDRQTGKTSLCVDAMLNQAHSDVICIYCAVGQRGDAVAKVVAALRAADMLERVIVMAAGDEDATGLAYIAPYSAMAMAEYFSGQGRDVLIVFDDLTHHARSYRELSLLLRRPPGREAFPGDIFYIHARLLERAGQFTDRVGGGSITALGVVETQAENLSAYIPTNLISITDGQIYLSPRLVRKNQFPAVDLGKSVSRVGGKAQTAAFRKVAGNLRVTLSQFEELEDFARFGTRLDDATRARLTRGAAVRGALRQAERDPMPAISQLVILTAAQTGVFDDLDEAAMRAVMDQIKAEAPVVLADIAKQITQGAELDDVAQAEMCALAQKARATAKGGEDVPIA